MLIESDALIMFKSRAVCAFKVMYKYTQLTHNISYLWVLQRFETAKVTSALLNVIDKRVILPL